jgi:hypothetical protein
MDKVMITGVGEYALGECAKGIVEGFCHNGTTAHGYISLGSPPSQNKIWVIWDTKSGRCIGNPDNRNWHVTGPWPAPKAERKPRSVWVTFTDGFEADYIESVFREKRNERATEFIEAPPGSLVIPPEKAEEVKELLMALWHGPCAKHYDPRVERALKRGGE